MLVRSAELITVFGGAELGAEPWSRRGGFLDGILYVELAVRPSGCSWGVRGRQLRPFTADCVGIRGILAAIEIYLDICIYYQN